jgi:hypothetical protein
MVIWETSIDAISIPFLRTSGLRETAFRAPLFCGGFLADRATALRGVGLRATVRRLGLAGRFLAAECLFMTQL